jgi:hypothetical protein
MPFCVRRYSVVGIVMCGHSVTGAGRAGLRSRCVEPLQGGGEESVASGVEGVGIEVDTS